MEIASANVPTFETKGVRALVPNDFDEWVKPNTDYLVEEGLPVQGTIAERKAQFVDQTKAGYWWGAFDNKQLVATAALNAIYGTIGQVGGVYTVPEKRRRGLARSAMLLLLNDSKNRHHLRRLSYLRASRISPLRNYTSPWVSRPLVTLVCFSANGKMNLGTTIRSSHNLMRNQ
jgi:hypothetical protein